MPDVRGGKGTFGNYCKQSMDRRKRACMPPLSRTSTPRRLSLLPVTPCLYSRKLEKLQKLREDTRKLEEELKEALLHSCMDRLAESGI